MRRRLTVALAVLVSFGSVASARAQTPEAAFSTVEVLNVPSPVMLFGVNFPDDLHGYAVGAYGVILATKDGGRTWVKQDSPVERPANADGLAVTLRAVSFTDVMHGWAVGDPNLIVSTSDGGATWVEHDAPPINEHQAPRPPGGGDPSRAWTFNDVQFTDGQRGHLVGEGGAIFATSDGGATWNWQGSDRFGRMTHLAFPDPLHGRAVGEAAPFSYVTVATDDGGQRWTAEKPPEIGPQVSNAAFTSVSFVNSRQGYVAGSSGRIFATPDGGRNWSVQRKDTTETFYGLSFGDERRGAAVGFVDIGAERRASIVTTGDGGETWVARPVKGVILRDVDFATPTIAYAVGCEVHPAPEEELPCQKSEVVRITFPSAAAKPGGGGGFAVPLPFLIVLAVLVAALGGILMIRRQPKHERH